MNRAFELLFFLYVYDRTSCHTYCVKFLVSLVLWWMNGQWEDGRMRLCWTRATERPRPSLCIIVCILLYISLYILLYIVLKFRFLFLYDIYSFFYSFIYLFSVYIYIFYSYFWCIWGHSRPHMHQTPATPSIKRATTDSQLTVTLLPCVSCRGSVHEGSREQAPQPFHRIRSRPLVQIHGWNLCQDQGPADWSLHRPHLTADRNIRLTSELHAVPVKMSRKIFGLSGQCGAHPGCQEAERGGAHIIYYSTGCSRGGAGTHEGCTPNVCVPKLDTQRLKLVHFENKTPKHTQSSGCELPKAVSNAQIQIFQLEKNMK